MRSGLFMAAGGESRPSKNASVDCSRVYLIESTLGHYLRLSLVVLVSEAFNVLEQHLGVAG
jgi:hypothetical protein